MNKEPTHRTSPALYVAGGMAGSLVVLLMLLSLFRAADPNVALARTAERAIQMAEESRREAEIARRKSAIGVLALVADVDAPSGLPQAATEWRKQLSWTPQGL